MKKYFIIFLTCLSGLSNAYAQISVSPLLMHLNDKNKSSHFTVYNLTNDTLECLLNNNFGYPVSDDSGNVFVKMMDSIPVNEPSAREWIKLYPKNFFLNPASSQVVRILAKPPDKIISGEYWSRPSITAKKKISGFQDGSSQTELSTTINTELRMFLALNYRSGKVSTNIAASILNFNNDGKNLHFLISLERIGNAAFLGKIVTRLIENNNLFYDEEVDIAVYHDMKKRISIPLEKISKKSFRVEIEINSDRNDDGADILKIDPIILRKNIVLE